MLGGGVGNKIPDQSFAMCKKVFGKEGHLELVGSLEKWEHQEKRGFIRGGKLYVNLKKKKVCFKSCQTIKIH